MTASEMTMLGAFTIDENHPSLPGHFPGNPVVPGVVVLDHALALVSAAHGVSDRIPDLMRVKFVAPVLPAQRVQVFSTPSGERVALRCQVDGRLVLEARVRPDGCGLADEH